MTRGVTKPKRKPGHRAKFQTEEDRCGSPPLERCPWCGDTANAGACCPWANAGTAASPPPVGAASPHAAGGMPGPKAAPRRRKDMAGAPTAEALGSTLRKIADAEDGWRPVSPRKRKVKCTSGSQSVTEGTQSDACSLAADFEQVQIQGSCAAWSMLPTLEVDGWVELVASDL